MELTYTKHRDYFLPDLDIPAQEMIAFLKSEGTAIREYDDSLVRKFIDCIMVYDYSITIRFKTGKK